MTTQEQPPVPFETTLENFLKSDDFEKGVISSTKAGWGGGSYKVELMPDGTWEVLWSNQIGNKYESPGIIMTLPCVSTESMSEYVENGGGTEDQFLSEAFDCEEHDLKESMQDDLSYRLTRREMYQQAE